MVVNHVCLNHRAIKLKVKADLINQHNTTTRLIFQLQCERLFKCEGKCTRDVRHGGINLIRAANVSVKKRRSRKKRTADLNGRSRFLNEVLVIC